MPPVTAQLRLGKLIEDKDPANFGHLSFHSRSVEIETLEDLVADNKVCDKDNLVVSGILRANVMATRSLEPCFSRPIHLRAAFMRMCLARNRIDAGMDHLVQNLTANHRGRDGCAVMSMRRGCCMSSYKRRPSNLRRRPSDISKKDS